MLYPKIGIRPTIDGRWGGVRESLEKHTMEMAQNAAKLISDNLRYPDGTPVQCVISSTTIGGGAEAALKEAGKDIKAEALVLGSDGFFPFDDTVTLAAEYGVKAIVQPGGSVRDEDSVKKANECGITMLCTGMRHFKH